MAIPVDSVQREYDSSGTISLVNTTENLLFTYTKPTLPHIGETWNLTVRLFSNSTTGINVSYQNLYLLSPDWWEGQKNFLVHPNETQTQIYVSHITGDTPLGLAFYIRLLNNTQNAWGTYELTKLHSGYEFPVDTAHLYVSDISAWLEEMSGDNSTPFDEKIFVIGIPVIALLVISVLIYRKRIK
jgi:hypothetical protein